MGVIKISFSIIFNKEIHALKGINFPLTPPRGFPWPSPRGAASWTPQGTFAPSNNLPWHRLWSPLVVVVSKILKPGINLHSDKMLIKLAHLWDKSDETVTSYTQFPSPRYGSLWIVTVHITAWDGSTWALSISIDKIIIKLAHLWDKSEAIVINCTQFPLPGCRPLWIVTARITTWDWSNKVMGHFSHEKWCAISSALFL